MEDDKANAERTSFLILASLFEGGLLLIAVIIGCFQEQPAWTRLRFTPADIGLGIVATIPLLGFLIFTYYSRIPQLVQLRELSNRLIGPSLAACRWYELCAVALLAGVSEEFVFRGTVEPWLSGWGTVVSIVGCNLIFGMFHAVSPTYFLFATLVGCYLSLTLRWTATPNLLVPIICHALYDLVAFVVIARSRNRLQSSTDTAVLEPEDSDSAIFPVSQ